MPLPVPGPLVPRRGNALTRAWGRLVFRALGWRFGGEVPACPKCVLIAAPHTSTADIFVAMATKVSLGLDIRWFAKHTIFWPPLGWLVRFVGGFPIDRTAAHGVVGQVVEMFRTHERLWIGIAPEGTRRPVAQWKLGFHRIACTAGVPIVTIALDYSTRTVFVSPPYQPTGDVEADLAVLRSRFRAPMARHRDRYVE